MGKNLGDVYRALETTLPVSSTHLLTAIAGQAVRESMTTDSRRADFMAIPIGEPGTI